MQHRSPRPLSPYAHPEPAGRFYQMCELIEKAGPHLKHLSGNLRQSHRHTLMLMRARSEGRWIRSADGVDLRTAALAQRRLYIHALRICRQRSPQPDLFKGDA